MSRARKQAKRPTQQLGARARQQIPTGGHRRQPAATGPTPDSAHPPTTSYYLDVAAVRIQAWLARSRNLRGWRGASIMLQQATSHEEWKDKLPAGTEWNDEVGDLDGVVSLKASDPSDERAVGDVLTNAARDVARDLRRRLPHCDLQAVTASGVSYAEAYPAITAKIAAGDLVVDMPARPTEVILAVPCHDCRQAPAEVSCPEPDGTHLACGECARRVKSAGGTKGGWEKRSPKPERDVTARLRALGFEVQFPDDFKDMAGDETQIALIYADGNKVGAFLEQAAKHPKPSKDEIVRAISAATVGAVATTIRGRFQPGHKVPVLVHVAGGDDMMLSARACDAWPLTRALLAGFTSELGKEGRFWPPSVLKTLPTLSAGLVFHHRTDPFPDMTRLAKGQLKNAKREVKGAHASISFLDVTADGGEPPAGRPACRLDDLAAKDSLLGQLAAVPESQRNTLMALIRQIDAAVAFNLSLPPEDVDLTLRTEAAEAKLARRVSDGGHEAICQVVLDSDEASRQAAAAALAVDHPDRFRSRRRLRDALDVARWWPAS